jgi:hypothetical protein
MHHLSPKQWWFLNAQGTEGGFANSFAILAPLGLCFLFIFGAFALALCGVKMGAGIAVSKAMCAAAAPRERLLGSLAYNRNGFSELIQGKGGGLSAEIYDYFRLQLVGTEEKNSSLNFTVNDGNPFSLLKSIQTRHGSDAWNDISGKDLRQLSHKIHDEYRRAKEAPNTVATSNDATSVNPVQDVFSTNLYFPFRLDDMTLAGKRSGAWATNRYGASGASTPSVRVIFGNETDLTTEAGVVVKHDIINCQINVYGRVWSGDSKFEPAKFLLNSRTTEFYDVNNTAWKDKKLEIKNRAAKLRGVLLYAYTDQPETPQTNLIPADAAITLLFNNSDRKYEYTAQYIQELNEANYGARLDDGYYYIDLAEDGDFGRLQDLSAGTFELVIGKTNAIANAKLRVVSEYYAPSM